MKGFYLYGVCPFLKTKKPLDKNIDNGIDEGRAFGVPYKDIEAIVSEISLKEFGASEIQKRAENDLEWIKDKAQIHERVIEEAMGLYPRKSALRAKRVPIRVNPRGITIVIPMKFGTVFKNREGLLDSLKKNYLKFKHLIKDLRGKEERSVKIYLRPQFLENEIKKNSPAIRKRFEEIKSLPAGRQYFWEEEINEMAKREARKSVNNYIPLFLEGLNGSAEKLKENKILGKELTQRNDPMVFNGAFLVKKEKVERFQMEIQKLQTEYEKIGFSFESSGPWPPYNFVN